MKVNIVSGWSNPGGSTTAFINLTNLFNDKGLETIFFGPHDYHLNKCKSEKFQNIQLSKNDVLIYHFVDFKQRFPCKTILSCHETNLYDLKEHNLENTDVVHFVSESQKKWHNINHNSVIIPNVMHTFKDIKKKVNKVAGIIGSIDSHKQVHISIQRALENGYDRINIYGLITDQKYYNDYIIPLLERNKGILLCGFVDNKDDMYSNITEVFHSSKRETFNYVKQECLLTNTKYNGLDSCNVETDILSNDEIFEKWSNILQ